ncbi:F-box domain-containing protein [Mycena kentingensis (nom. inval.)]|nr:F-box domain-containing protein [Mycena kentingensis (nom. inval.)]
MYLTELFPLPDTVAEIDAHIQFFEAHVSALKTKRNSLTPLDKLPNEILARIITTYAHISGNLFGAGWCKQILRVCRRWYEIGMAEQSLWSYIKFSRFSYYGRATPVWLQLERSGAAALTMHVQLYDENAYMVEWMLEHAERTGAFDVGGDAKLVLNFLRELVKLRTGRLWSLHLSPGDKQEELTSGDVLAIPRALFDSPDCQIRSLHLYDIAFPWDLPSNLHSLHLGNASNSSSPTTPTVAELVELLSRCPEIQDIRLGRSCVLSPFFEGVVVPLASLDTLDYEGPTVSALALLKSVRIPPTTNIDLKLFDIHDGTAIRDLIVLLRAHLRAPGAPRLSTMVITTIGDSEDLTPAFGLSIEFTSIHKPRFIALEYPGCPRLGLTVLPWNEPSLRQIVTKLLHAAQTQHITHLDADRVFRVGETSWKAILRNLPALQSVQLTAHEVDVAGSTRSVTGILGAFIALGEIGRAPYIRKLKLELLRHAYLAHRRAAYAADADVAALEVLQLVDDSSITFTREYSPIMRRMFRLLKAMGGVFFRRGDVDSVSEGWDPAEDKRRRRELKEWQRRWGRIENVTSESESDIEDE